MKFKNHDLLKLFVCTGENLFISVLEFIFHPVEVRNIQCQKGAIFIGIAREISSHLVFAVDPSLHFYVLSINTIDNINDSEVRPYVEIYVLHIIIFLKNEAETTLIGEIYAVNVVTFLVKCVICHYRDSLE